MRLRNADRQGTRTLYTNDARERELCRRDAVVIGTDPVIQVHELQQRAVVHAKRHRDASASEKLHERLELRPVRRGVVVGLRVLTRHRLRHHGIAGVYCAT